MTLDSTSSDAFRPQHGQGISRKLGAYPDDPNLPNRPCRRRNGHQRGSQRYVLPFLVVVLPQLKRGKGTSIFTYDDKYIDDVNSAFTNPEILEAAFGKELMTLRADSFRDGMQKAGEE